MAETEVKRGKPLPKQGATEMPAAAKVATEGKAQSPPETTSSAASFFDPIIEPFRKWVDYIRPNLVRYYAGLLKINIVSLLVGWAFVLLFAMIAIAAVFLIVGSSGISMSGLMKIIGNMTAIIVILIAGVLIFAAMSWAKTSIDLSAVLYTDSEFNGKSFDIIGSAWSIKWKALLFIITDIAIWFVIMLPIIAAVLVLIATGALAGAGLSGPSSGSGAFIGVMGMFLGIFLLEIAAFAYIIFMLLAFGFLAQFWRFGFLLGGMGIVESLKASVSIIKRNPLEVLVFDILWVVGFIIFSIPLFTYAMFSNFLLDIARLITETSGKLELWAIYLLLVAVSAVITAFLSTLVQIFILPTPYLLWKRMRGSRFIYNAPAILHRGALIVGDTHFGMEGKLRRRGIYDEHFSVRLYLRLRGLVEEHKAKRLILLGDVKEDITMLDSATEGILARLSMLCQIIIVKGNHDGGIERCGNARIVPSPKASSTRAGPHARPFLARKELMGCRYLVSGHQHPMVGITDAFGKQTPRARVAVAPADKDAARFTIPGRFEMRR